MSEQPTQTESDQSPLGDTVFLIVDLGGIPAGSKGTVLHAGPGGWHVAFPMDNAVCTVLLLKDSFLLSPTAFIVRLLENIHEATAGLDIHQFPVGQFREYISKRGVFPTCAKTVCALLVSQRRRISPVEWYEVIREFYLKP